MPTKSWKSRVFPWAGQDGVDQPPPKSKVKVSHHRRRSSLFDMVKHALDGGRDRHELELAGATIPTWLKDKRSLLRTKELVNSARPQDRVKVIRGTNQKNQLEQEAWKIVIKIMILKKTMQEEEEREEQKIMMAASDAGTLDAAAASSTDDDLGNASCPSGAHDPHGSSPQDARSRGTFFGDDGASVVGRGGSASRSHASGSSIISRTGSASGGGAAGDAVAVLDGSFGRTNSSAAAVAKLFSRAGSSFKAHKGSSLVKLRVLIKEKILSTKAKYERAKEELLQLLQEENHRLEPDPVGAIPLHACFLLGLADIGKDLIDHVYKLGESKCDINTPYMSDLDPWKVMGVLDEHDHYDDGGLYTGETCLHIAIVQSLSAGDASLVEWMLQRGAHITCRATGSFFKGKVIKLRSGRMKGGSEDLDVHPRGSVQGRARRLRPIANAYSACDYGEYPLAFAASIGSIESCKLIAEHKMKADEWLEFVKDQRHITLDLEKDLGSQSFANAGWAGQGNYSHVTSEHQNLSMPVAPSERKQFLFSPRAEQAEAHISVIKTVTPFDGQSVPQDPVATYDLFMNAQDSAGNTALHMAVFHNKINAVDWLIQEGAKPSLRLLNQDGLTPFTLAAKLGNTEMLYHILNTHMKVTLWAYGSVMRTQMSLEQMDSFRIKDNDLHDMPNWRSAIEIIVEHEVVEFAKDPLFNKLIKEKWQKFGRRRYILRSLLPYVIYLIVFTFMVVVRCIEVRDVFERSRNGEMLDLSGETIVEWGNRIMQDDRGARTQLQVRQSMAVVVLQALLGGPGSLWLFSQGWVSRRLSRRDLDPEDDGHRNWTSFVFKNMNFILHCLSSILVWAALIARCVGAESIELDFLAVASISIWCNLLVLTVPFEFFGYIIITTYKMLVGDVVQFAAAYVSISAGFSFAIFALFQMSPSPEESPIDADHPLVATMWYFWVSMADQLDIDFSLSRSPNLLVAVHLTYIVVSPLLLINLLIAMMGQTFERNAEDTHRTWIFPFASLVLKYEKDLGGRERRDKDGRFRSGVYDEPDSDESDSDDKGRKQPPQRQEDPESDWKSKYYIIHVGEDSGAKLEQERKRVYKANHHAVIDKIESLFEESKINPQKTRRKEVTQKQENMRRNSSIQINLSQSERGSVAGQTSGNAFKNKNSSEKMVIIKNDLSTILEAYGEKDPGSESHLAEPVSKLWLEATGEKEPGSESHLAEPVSVLWPESTLNKEDSEAIQKDPADDGSRDLQSPHSFNESYISHAWTPMSQKPLHRDSVPSLRRKLEGTRQSEVIGDSYQAPEAHAPAASAGTGTGADAPAQTSEGEEQEGHGAVPADVTGMPKQGRRLTPLPPSQRRNSDGKKKSSGQSGSA